MQLWLRIKQNQARSLTTPLVAGKPVTTPIALPKTLSNAPKNLPEAPATKAPVPKIAAVAASTTPVAVVGAAAARTATPSSLVDGDAPPLDAKAGDKLLLRPVVKGPRNRMALLALHGALMLLAFVVLLPLGALVSRHRWVFGRDTRTVSLGDPATAGAGVVPALQPQAEASQSSPGNGNPSSTQARRWSALRINLLCNPAPQTLWHKHGRSQTRTHRARFHPAGGGSM